MGLISHVATYNQLGRCGNRTAVNTCLWLVVQSLSNNLRGSQVRKQEGLVREESLESMLLQHAAARAAAEDRIAQALVLLDLEL